MRVCLIYPQWADRSGNVSYFASKLSNFPPLNLANLAAMVERHGHECRIIDGQIEDKTEDEVVAELAQNPPDLIGFSATTPFFHLSVGIAQKLKEVLPKVPLVIGGHHVTVLGEAAMDPAFDYGFIGEADHSFPEFLDALAQGKDVLGVKGLLARRDGQVMSTGAADPVLDLDALPLPARHLLKMDRYISGTLEGPKPYTTIATTRGCPFKCIFCSTDVFGPRLRKRTPEKVIEEIRDVIQRYGIRHFFFLDDTMTLDRAHFTAICQLIIASGLKITFEGSTRANLVDEELIRIMSKAGLIRLSFGLESVDEDLRKTMKKDIPVKAYLEANRLTNKYGIETLNSCMIGLPGETVESICKTLKFLRNSKEIKQANVSIAVPYPGTELYRLAKSGAGDYKLLTEDFSRYRRYNAAVTQVGELGPDDLIRLQNDAILSVNLAYWRWRSIVKRSGFYGLWLTFSRIKDSVKTGRINVLNNQPRKNINRLVGAAAQPGA